KMSQAVNTLLTQAIKVTPPEARVAVSLRPTEGGVELKVADSGSDLPPEKAAKVFSDFHGIDTQAGPEFIGSGLRFTILQAIIEAHGGSVRLETGGGGGKAFVIDLPASAEATAGMPSLASLPVLAPPPPSPVKLKGL